MQKTVISSPRSKEKIRIGTHPAKFSDVLLPPIAEMIAGSKRLLDPMAGTGKVSCVKTMGFNGQVFCNDLEDWPEAEECAALVDRWTHTDAAMLPYPDGHFDAIATSPTYGNGMNRNSDDRNWRRHTYMQAAGGSLADANTARWQWGKTYHQQHEAIYRELYRVAAIDARVVINVSDFVRRGQVVNATEWHRLAMEGVGFRHIRTVQVECKRNRCGLGGNVRVKYENVMLFVKN